MDQRPDELKTRSLEKKSGESEGDAARDRERELADETRPEIDQIRTTIERSEAKLSQTIDAIQERLSLDHLVRDAGAKFQQEALKKIDELIIMLKRKSENIGVTAIEAIKENPVPSVLIGAGICWFVLRGLGGSAEEKSDAPGRAIHGDEVETGSRVSLGRPVEIKHTESAVSGRRGQVHRSPDAVPETFGKEPERAGAESEIAGREGDRRRERETSGYLSRIVRERPLAAGLGGLIAGASLWLALSGSFSESDDEKGT
ncbi:MAG: hypothetical protein AAGU11_07605 [Syntrophobacteraceae bacterium]